MIKRFLVNGSEEKLSKSVLGDEISDGLLPAATSEDEGKVVCVNNAGQYELSTVESGLPVATAEDAGKVVSVDDSGEYELAVPSGGGGSLVVFYAKAIGLYEIPSNDTWPYLDPDCTQRVLPFNNTVINNYLSEIESRGSVIKVKQSAATHVPYVRYVYPIMWRACTGSEESWMSCQILLMSQSGGEVTGTHVENLYVGG